MPGSHMTSLGPLVFEARDGLGGGPAMFRLSIKGPDGLPGAALFKGAMPSRFAEDLQACARVAEEFQPDPGIPDHID